MVFLGFFREASAIVHEFELSGSENRRHPLLDEMLVIDFNPVVYSELQRRGIECVYGDVAHMDTLHHAKIHDAEVVISTIPDHILKGTDNERLAEKDPSIVCPTRTSSLRQTARAPRSIFMTGAQISSSFPASILQARSQE